MTRLIVVRFSAALAMALALTVTLGTFENVVFLTERPLIRLPSRLRPWAVSTPDDVLIVDINRPRQRAELAALVQEIASGGARAIGFTIVFAGAKDADGDSLFLSALDQAGTAVLGYVEPEVYPFPVRDGEKPTRIELGYLNLAYSSWFGFEGIEPRIVRNGKEHLSFPVAVALKLDSVRARQATTYPKLHPNFYGPPATFKRIMMEDFRKYASLNQLNGKIVIVDSSSTSLMAVETAVGSMWVGEIHANLIANILYGGLLIFSRVANAVVGLIAATVILLGRWRSLAAAAVLLCAHWVVSILCIVLFGLVTSL